MKPFGSCGRQKYTVVSEAGTSTGSEVVDSPDFILRDFVTLDTFIFLALGMEGRGFAVCSRVEDHGLSTPQLGKSVQYFKSVTRSC